VRGFVLGVDLDGVCGDYESALRASVAARRGRPWRHAATAAQHRALLRVGALRRGFPRGAPRRRRRGPHLPHDGPVPRRRRGALASVRRWRVDPHHHPPSPLQRSARVERRRHRGVARPARHPLPRPVLHRRQGDGRCGRLHRRQPPQHREPPRGGTDRGRVRPALQPASRRPRASPAGPRSNPSSSSDWTATSSVGAPTSRRTSVAERALDDGGIERLVGVLIEAEAMPSATSSRSPDVRRPTS
jgi:hypothetical protein